MADLKAQITLTADASGVKVGIDDTKKNLRSLGVTAVAEGKKAADGIERIGSGSEKAAKKVERDQRNLVNSIQRTIAVTEAGGKSGSKFFEVLAAQRGVDTNVLKPYLDQLRAVETAQATAATALQKGGAELNKYGVSARQTAAAMRGVPAQLTDIIVGLQGGQAPLTVLLQQGGQLKDMFGGIVPAAKALGGAVAGLVNPYTLAASAVASLGLAYFRGAKESDEFAKALVLSGNAAGATTAQLSVMAARLSGISGSQSEAASAVARFAASGDIAATSIERFTSIALRMEKLTGQSVDATVKQFAELGKAPVEASVKLNQSTNFLTESLYKQIKALADQGKAAEAGTLAQNTFATVMDTRLTKVAERLGYVERGWNAVGSAAKWAISQMLQVGREDTLDQQIAKSEAAIQRLQKLTGNNIVGGGGAARAAAARRAQEELSTEQSILDGLRKRQSLEKNIADQQRRAAAETKAAIKADEDKKKQPKGSRADPEAEGKRYLESLEKQVEKTRDLSVYEQALADIQAKRLGKITPDLEKSILAMAKQVDVSQRAKEALESLNTARQRAVEMSERFDASAFASVTQQIQANQALREEVEMLGLTVAARSAVEQARLSSAIALKEEELIMLRNADASAVQIEALEREIALLKERGSLLGERGRKTIELDEIEKAKSYTKELNTDLKRAFSDAFADTKNPIKAFGDSLFSTVASRVSAALAESMATNVLKSVGQGAGSEGGWGSLISAIFGGATKNALGGVYASPGLSAYSGTVVSKPTVFPFAKGGAVGLMGEAGHEAILPLRRGTDGRLGVQAGSGGGVSLTIVNNGAPVDGKIVSKGTAPDGTQLLELVLNAAADGVANRSGPLARALESGYGLRPVMG